MKRQSFTQQVKEELCRNEYESKDRLRALLAAYIRINGSFYIHNKKSYVSLETENALIAKFIYQTIKDIYPQIEVTLSYRNRQNGDTLYNLLIDESEDSIVDDLEVSFVEGKISKNIVRNDDTISGYLAGAFLASGSVNSPETSNYHLEISCLNENFAKWLSKLFAKYKNSDIEPKIVKRRERYVIYFKKSDQIADFLIMIGAVSSCMEFENIRVDRDVMNSANRLENIDMANMKKTIETGQRQVEEIRFIDDLLGIKNISNKKMRILAILRLENESASLNELAELMSEKLEKDVTKSNINHLFRSLHKLYLELSHHES